MRFWWNSSLDPFENQPAGKNQADKTVRDLVSVSTASLIRLRVDAEGMALKAGRIRSRQSGSYLSPFKGRGMEFDESRLYQPGDDIRTLDWRVTARTGKPHTKMFREERERGVLMWVDFRDPMMFATRGRFKSVIAAHAAALLAWSALQHSDRLGGLIFSEQHHRELRPQRGVKAVLHLLRQLSEHPAWTSKPTPTIPTLDGVNDALLRLRRVSHPGSLIFLISDFRGFDQSTLRHVANLARHNDLVLLHIHDPLERQLPPAGLYRISDGKRNMTLDSANRKLCAQHAVRFTQAQVHLKTWCRSNRVHYISCGTEQDVVEILQRELGLKRS